MGSNKIETLLERYFEGETSLEEEAVLRKYFNEEQNIPEAWIPYQQFFGYCEVAKKETYPSVSNRTKTSNRSWIFAAASIAVLLTLQVGGVFDDKNTITEQQQAELAFQQFQIQMKTVSNHLNRGVQKVAYLDYWNDTTQKFIK